MRRAISHPTTPHARWRRRWGAAVASAAGVPPGRACHGPPRARESHGGAGDSSAGVASRAGLRQPGPHRRPRPVEGVTYGALRPMALAPSGSTPSAPAAAARASAPEACGMVGWDLQTASRRIGKPSLSVPWSASPGRRPRGARCRRPTVGGRLVQARGSRGGGHVRRRPPQRARRRLPGAPIPRLARDPTPRPRTTSCSTPRASSGLP